MLPEKDGNQLVEAIKAFREGRQQPSGRFVIKGSLSVESTESAQAKPEAEQEATP